MKAILIARVSTEEQKEMGNSLPAQEERLKRYAQMKGFQIIKIFSFDESAYQEKRVEFDDILKFITAQKETVAVCYDKVDRFTRNMFDPRISSLYHKACNGDIELHFASDNQVIRKGISAVEKFFFSLSLGASNHVSNSISDNVKRGLEQKKRRGEFSGKAPFGYKNIRNSDDKREIVIDEYAAGVVKQVFDWYATGAHSMNTIREKLKVEHGITWSKGYIDWLLKNSFYYGEMVYPNSI